MSLFMLVCASPDASADGMGGVDDGDLFALEREFEKAGELVQEIVSIREELANLGFKIELGKELWVPDLDRHHIWPKFLRYVKTWFPAFLSLFPISIKELKRLLVNWVVAHVLTGLKNWHFIYSYFSH